MSKQTTTSSQVIGWAVSLAGLLSIAIGLGFFVAFLTKQQPRANPALWKRPVEGWDRLYATDTLSTVNIGEGEATANLKKEFFTHYSQVGQLEIMRTLHDEWVSDFGGITTIFVGPTGKTIATFP